MLSNILSQWQTSNVGKVLSSIYQVFITSTNNTNEFTKNQMEETSELGEVAIANREAVYQDVTLQAEGQLANGISGIVSGVGQAVGSGIAYKSFNDKLKEINGQDAEDSKMPNKTLAKAEENQEEPVLTNDSNLKAEQSQPEKSETKVAEDEVKKSGETKSNKIQEANNHYQMMLGVIQAVAQAARSTGEVIQSAFTSQSAGYKAAETVLNAVTELNSRANNASSSSVQDAAKLAQSASTLGSDMNNTSLYHAV